MVDRRPGTRTNSDIMGGSCAHCWNKRPLCERLLDVSADFSDFWNNCGLKLHGKTQWAHKVWLKRVFLMWFCLRHPYNQLQKKMQFFSQASLLFYVILLTTCSLSNIDSSLFPTSDGTSLEFLQGKAWTLDMMVWCVICDTWYLTFSFFGVFLRWKLLSIIQFAERKKHFSD